MRDLGRDCHVATVYNIADVHCGAAESRQAEFRRFVNWLSTQPDAYIVLGGDLANNATRSSVSDIFEETMRPREQKRWLADALKPIKSKILCIVSGNHENRGGKDADDDFMGDVAAKLDLEDVYHQHLAVVNVQLSRERPSNANPVNYYLVVTHGAGGGMLSGATINRNERFIDMFEGTDVLLTGHSHKSMGSRTAKVRIDPSSKTLVQREQVILSACPWMEWGGYAMRKMMRPSPQALNSVVLGGVPGKKALRLVI